MGTQITRVVLPYQVYVLTNSTLAVGGLTAVQLVPILVFALGGGAVADAVDRRRLLAVTQIGLASCSLALVLLSLMASPPLAAILAVAFVAAGLSAVDQPARASTIPRLVPPERLPAAIALNQVSYQGASVIGPAIGGLLLATIGPSGAYAVDVATFAASLLALRSIPPVPPLAGAVRPSLAAVREGLRFAFRRRVILSCFVIDLDAMVFGMPTALFPALALDVFRAGPAGVGLLAAAPAFGALLGALLSGWVSHVRRIGRAVVAAVLVWGFAIVGFGLSAFMAVGLVAFAFGLALVFLAIAGAADVVSAMLRNTIVQLESPDQLRGRVTSLNILVVTSGPRLGDIEAAAVAAAVGAPLSVLSGGILCVLGLTAVVRAFPELATHRIGTRSAEPEAAA